MTQPTNVPTEILYGLTDGANLRGNEYAWPLDLFPVVVEKAKSLGLGCLGGQFQFRTPNSTCEMYWLNADPSDGPSDETWDRYASRSCTEVLSEFSSIATSTNFRAEGSRWKEVPELSEFDASPEKYLCFVAYFVNETEFRNLRGKRGRMG